MSPAMGQGSLRGLLAWAGLAACAAVAGADAGGSWKWTPEIVVDTVAVSGVALSPDGASVVFGRSRWRGEDAKPGPAYVNLWRVPFEGGEPERLTSADAEDGAAHWSPDGRTIAFLSRRGGENAKTRIWLLPAKGGEPSAASDEKTDVLGYAWSPDGRRLAYVALEPKSEQKEKDEKAGRDALVVDQDLRPRRLYLLDPATRKAERLASLGELSAWDFAWSPDGSALAASVTERNRMDDSYMLKRLVVLPLQGETRELAGVLGKVGPVAWSPDGRTIAWLGGVDASDPSLGSVFVVPAAGGPARNLSGGREETAGSLAWRKDGRLAVTTGAGTRSFVWLVDVASGNWQQALASPPAPLGVPSWSDDGLRYAFAGSTSSQPTDVYAGTLASAAKGKPASAGPRRIGNANPQLEALPRGAQETIRYPARDGLTIEAVLVRPTTAAGGGRRPLIVVVHGGPESHYLDAWNNSASAPAQLLAERGYLVLFPNYRGSTGRGVAFAKADHKDLGGKEFEDVLAGIDFLAAKGEVDAARVGITGGSYGGYFTALGVTRHSERFAAGVELFGIANWESFLGQSDIPAENALVHWNLWCYEHAELCRDRSPVAHWDKARTPTLILQGDKDERVPKPQSDELYAALRYKKVPVEYVVYPREGHGFRERWHRLDALTRTLGWFERHLGAPPGAEAR
jgi:dipeptidyl aminopeptidase/acylaminoacyl peptidase